MGYYIAHKESKLWRVYEILEKEHEKRKEFAKEFIRNKGYNDQSVETDNYNIYMNREDIPKEKEEEFIIGEERGRIRKISNLNREWLDFVKERYENKIDGKDNYKLVDFSLGMYVPGPFGETIDEENKEIYFICGSPLKYIQIYSHDDLIEEMDEEEYLKRRLAYIKNQKKKGKRK